MTEPVVPPSIRGTDAEAEWAALRPGVPAGMVRPLAAWVRPYLIAKSGVGDVRKALLQIGLDLHRDDLRYRSWLDVDPVLERDPDLFIDVADWCLRNKAKGIDAAVLENILGRANSCWRVGHTSGVSLNDALSDVPAPHIDANGKTVVRMPSEVGTFELQRRVDPTLEQAMIAAAHPRTSAAIHLRRAWNEVHARSGNAKSGYDESVIATEAATKPIISPNDASYTLGRGIGAMRANLDLWTSPLGKPGVTSALEAMRALWLANQRHGSETPVIVTQEQAEVAVQLAVALVTLFSTGGVTRAG